LYTAVSSLNGLDRRQTRPEGALDLNVSARQQAGGWRVSVSKTER
jgi:hypothetical protein